MAFVGIPSRLGLHSTPRRPLLCRRPSHHARATPVKAQLVGMPSGSGKSIEPDQNEILLAELRYSEPDKLPLIVQNSLPLLDEGFYEFLERRINESSDLEERDTLRVLRDAITDIMKQLYDSATKEGTTGGSIETGDASDIAEASYDELIDKLANAEDLKVAVSASYERVDMRLLERLTERIAGGEGGLMKVREGINGEMNARMGRAMEGVRMVLSAGDGGRRRKSVDMLARKGGVDDAFLLLLQANLEEARKAGAEEAVKVVGEVMEYARGVKEVGLDEEVKLIRALLRTEESEARVEMLMEGLKPRGKVTLVDGSETGGVRVDGKRFVTALRKLIEEFGNVDEGFVKRLSRIGEESEMVARKLFDVEDKDVQDLQNEAFYKRSVSIWDLEQFEVQEEMEGRKAAWEGRMGEIPEGFDESGKMSV